MEKEEEKKKKEEEGQENGGEEVFSPENSLTTEQVINLVADRPSWMMCLIWVGLMSFMAVRTS